MPDVPDSHEERERAVAFHQDELDQATKRLVIDTQAAVDAERVRLASMQDVHQCRANLDQALHALLSKAGKP